MPYEDCIRISMSIFTAKAFSMRKAISSKRSALAFRRLGFEALRLAQNAVEVASVPHGAQRWL